MLASGLFSISLSFPPLNISMHLSGEKLANNYVNQGPGPPLSGLSSLLDKDRLNNKVLRNHH